MSWGSMDMWEGTEMNVIKIHRIQFVVINTNILKNIQRFLDDKNY